MVVIASESAAAGAVRFADVVAQIERFPWHGSLSVRQVGSPQRIAPHGYALEADILNADTCTGDGRLVLLHDPAGHEEWGGTFRLISYTRAALDHEMATDPLLAEVGWSWVLEAFVDQDATYAALAGTVTCVTNTTFDAKGAQPVAADVEIRASWTPLLGARPDIRPHLRAWQQLLYQVSGVPLLPQGLTSLPIDQTRDLIP